MAETSTKPYLIRAIHEWCTDNGYRPYIAVAVDERTIVPREFVRAGEIVLNVSLDATSRLRLGNDLIEFEARFNRVARQLSIPIENVSAIYAAENGHGMAFEVAKPPAEPAEGGGQGTPALLLAVPSATASAPDPDAGQGESSGAEASSGEASATPAAPAEADRPAGAPSGGADEPPPPAAGPSGRPRLTRIK